MNTKATNRGGKEIGRTSKEAAWVGEATIACTEDVPATAWGGNSMVEAGAMETAAVGETG